MKIGLVLPYDLSRPGGVRSHIVGLGTALAKQGHTVHVIAPAPPTGQDPLPVIQCGRARGLHFSGTQIDFTLAGPGDLRKVCRAGYDLLHFHTIWNPLMPLQLAAVWHGPKVATFHDVPGPDTPGWARAIMPAASTTIRMLLVRHLIAVSAAAAAHLRPGTYRMIPNGVESPPPGDDLPKQDFLLFLGRLEPRKGLEVLLRALARMPQPRPRLIVAGDGPLRESMERLARQLELTDIEFRGEVTEAEKWQLLRQARLLVVPSLGGESFGIVLVEAMACGTPPLAAANEGYARVLQAQPALLTPVGDDAALAHRLQELLGSAQQLEDLRRWGLEEWRRYHWDALLPDIQAVYRRAGAPLR